MFLKLCFRQVAIGEGGIAFHHYIYSGSGRNGLAVQFGSILQLQPDIVVRPRGSILIKCEFHRVAGCYGCLGNRIAGTIAVVGLPAIDHEADIAVLDAEHGRNEIIGYDQIFRSPFPGEILSEHRFVSFHQYIQSGYAVCHRVRIAVAFCQIAGNRHIDLGRHQQAAVVLGHDGNCFCLCLCRGNRDHTVGCHGGAVPWNSGFTTVIPIRNVILYRSLGRHIIGTSLVKGQCHLTVFVSGLSLNGGEGTVTPDANADAADCRIRLGEGQRTAALQGQGEFLPGLYGLRFVGEIGVVIRTPFGVRQDSRIELVPGRHGAALIAHIIVQSNTIVVEIEIGTLRHAPQLVDLGAVGTLRGLITAGAISSVGCDQSLVIGQDTIPVCVRNRDRLFEHKLAALGLRQNAFITDSDEDLHRLGGSSLGCSSIRQQGIRRFFQQQMFRLLQKRLLCGRLRLLNGGLRLLFWGLPLLRGSLRFYDQCFRFLNEGFGSTFFQQSFIGQCLHGEHAKHHHDGKKHRQYASFHNCPSFLTFLSPQRIRC